MFHRSMNLLDCMVGSFSLGLMSLTKSFSQRLTSMGSSRWARGPGPCIPSTIRANVDGTIEGCEVGTNFSLKDQSLDGIAGPTLDGTNFAQDRCGTLSVGVSHMGLSPFMGILSSEGLPAEEES